LASGDFKKLVMAQEAFKMHTFLQFVFNVDNLKDNLREEWMQNYDFQYIDAQIIGGIEKNLPSVMQIMAYVERKATGKTASQMSMS